MYRNLEAEFVRKGFSKQKIAQMLGVGYNTLLAKMRGESSFTLDEAFKIQKIVSAEKPIEYLFEKLNNPHK